LRYNLSVFSALPTLLPVRLQIRKHSRKARPAGLLRRFNIRKFLYDYQTALAWRGF
jgi:hypothetical protein